jgi:hypothetical protein
VINTQANRQMLRIVFFVSTIVLFAIPCNAASWERLGPTGDIDINAVATAITGRVSSVSPTASGFLVATAGGGIWIYNSSPHKWQMAGLLPILSFGVVSVAPSDGRIVYAGSGEGHYCADCVAGRGLFRSQDGGQTWVAAQSTGTATDKSTSEAAYSPVRYTSVIVIDPRDPNHLWLGGDSGLWEAWWSSRNGWSWRAGSIISCATRPEGEPCVTSAVLDPFDPTILYVASSTGIWRVESDENRNLSVNQVYAPKFLNKDGRPVGGAYLIALAAGKVPTRRFYASVASDKTGCLLGIRRSNDGTRWDSVSAALNDYASRAHPPTIKDYPMSTIPDYFWLNYSYQELQPLVIGQPALTCTGGSAAYNDAIAVDPNNVDHIAVGGMNILYSADGGVTWDDRTIRYNLHHDVHSLVFSDGDLTAATDGGVYTVAADHAYSLSSGLPVLQFFSGAAYSPTGSFMIAGTQDNGTMLMTLDPNSSAMRSAKQVLDDDGGAAEVDRNDSRHVFAENPNGCLWSSGNGGKTWTLVSVSAASTGCSGSVLWWQNAAAIMPIRVSPVHANTIYVGADQIYQSDDGGQIWAAVPGTQDPSGGVVVAMDVVKLSGGATTDDALVAAWNSGTVYSSFDNGTTWFDLTPAIAPWLTVDVSGGANAGLGITDVRFASSNSKHVYVVLNRIVNGEFINRGGRVLSVADARHNALAADAVDISGDLTCTPYVIRSIGRHVLLGCDDGVYELVQSSATYQWARFGDGLPRVVVEDLVSVEGGIVAVTHGLGLWYLPTSD